MYFQSLRESCCEILLSLKFLHCNLIVTNTKTIASWRLLSEAVQSVELILVLAPPSIPAITEAGSSA